MLQNLSFHLSLLCFACALLLPVSVSGLSASDQDGLRRFDSLPVIADMNFDFSAAEKRIRVRDLTIELIDAYRFNQEEKAPAFLKELEKVAPDSAEYHYFQGLQHLRSEEQSLAILELQESVAKKKSFDPAWNLLGIAWIQANHLENAREAFASAIEASPYNPTYAYNYAEVLYRMEKLDKALEVATHAASLKANFSDAYHLLGKIHRKQGDHDLSFQAYRQAYDTGLSHRPFLIEFLRIAARLEQDRTVLALFEILSPVEDYELLILHADIRMKYGEYKRAAEILKDVVTGKNANEEYITKYLKAIHRSGADARRVLDTLKLTPEFKQKLSQMIDSWKGPAPESGIKDPIFNPIRG